MYRNLRILFCILAAICAAVCIFIFIYFGLWGLLPLGAGCAFAGLMFLFKNLQEREELKANPPPPVGDFITGKVTVTPSSDDANGSEGGDGDKKD